MRPQRAKPFPRPRLRLWIVIIQKLDRELFETRRTGNGENKSVLQNARAVFGVVNQQRASDKSDCRNWMCNRKRKKNQTWSRLWCHGMFLKVSSNFAFIRRTEAKGTSEPWETSKALRKSLWCGTEALQPITGRREGETRSFSIFLFCFLSFLRLLLVPTFSQMCWLVWSSVSSRTPSSGKLNNNNNSHRAIQFTES